MSHMCTSQIMGQLVKTIQIHKLTSWNCMTTGWNCLKNIYTGWMYVLTCWHGQTINEGQLPHNYTPECQWWIRVWSKISYKVGVGHHHVFSTLFGTCLKNIGEHQGLKTEKISYKTMSMVKDKCLKIDQRPKCNMYLAPPKWMLSHLLNNLVGTQMTPRLLVNLMLLHMRDLDLHQSTRGSGKLQKIMFI